MAEKRFLVWLSMVTSIMTITKASASKAISMPSSVVIITATRISRTARHPQRR